jgi:hypothetical protein
MIRRKPKLAETRVPQLRRLRATVERRDDMPEDVAGNVGDRYAEPGRIGRLSSESGKFDDRYLPALNGIAS